MRTTEERIAFLHRRTRQLKRKKLRMELLGSGLASICTLMLLLIFTAKSGINAVTLSGDYTASSLLSEDAGAYVLVAVLAFFAGVAVTAALRKWQNRKKSSYTIGEGGFRKEETEEQESVKTQSP